MDRFAQKTNDASDATRDPGLLEPATDLYWQVIGNGLNRPVNGPEWSFATASSGLDCQPYLPLVVR
jgi:hypothetical protein